jgi:hypothetical protein
MPSPVVILVNVGFDGPLRHLIRRWNGALAPYLSVASYQSWLTRRRVPAAAYVFSDFERVPSGDRADVMALWDALRASGSVHLVNDPRRVQRRYELLRSLFEQGLNDFNVYRADEDLRSVRFPAFVRCEHDHGGPRTGLLNTRHELEAALTRLREHRAWRSQLLVTECLAEPGDDGLFRKYGALLVNDRVVPWHVIASRTWLVKGSSRVRNERLREEQQRYIAHNPHGRQVQEAFAAASIGYGRIDYGLASDGRLRVFEINTNPAIGGAGRRRGGHGRQRTDAAVNQLIEAFAALAARCPAPGVTITLAPRRGALPGWAYQGLRHSQSLLNRYAHRPGIR